ncbi:LacI family DNA-binding transcriptional regulator [Terrarubrum flagellatum]|uniref:LacI family DNA-binding transcriptional regulator n=1 Tax=Terrirubrum flagellatum TaxID=2895980 RepID=UPI0031450E13
MKIRDVARAAGVAVGTVSRVLNQNPTVAEPIRRKVQAAIEALGYERDLIAQSMRGGATKLVACAIRDFDIPRFGAYIKEAERVLRDNGYTLLLSSTTNSPVVELELLRAFSRRRVDGVMMTISDEQHPSVAAAVAASSMPILLIDRDHIASLDRVIVDHRSGALLAVRHLIDLGHRRIAMLVGDTKAYPSRSRVEGYHEAFARMSLRPEPELLRDHVLTQEDAFRETMFLLDSPDPPTAIFVAAMDMLGGSLRAIRTLGRDVGKDVSLVAGSDSDLAELYTPPITAIRWDLAEMGRHAATMLLERMRGLTPPSARQVRLPCTLVIRASANPTG